MNELRLWLMGIGGLAVFFTVWVALSELINRSWHDLGASATAAFCLMVLVAFARLIAGMVVEARRGRDEFNERRRDFEKHQAEVRRALRK